MLKNGEISTQNYEKKPDSPQGERRTLLALK